MLNKVDLLDTTVEIVTGAHKAEYFYPEIEILYLLKGKAGLILGPESHQLSKDDVIVVNTSTPHTISTQEDSVLVRVKINFFKICRILETDYLIFWCNSRINNSHKYLELRRILNELILTDIENEGKETFKKYGLECYLISYLLENFRVNDDLYIQDSKKEEKRLAYIINYIQTHYMEKITLADISQKLFKSVSSLSRFFFKATGVSFVDYLKEFRVQKVTESLLYTNEAITKIAVDNGFSNPSIMNKAFLDVYQMTPSDFRSKFKGKQSVTKKNLASRLNVEDKSQLKELISVEVKQEKGKEKNIIIASSKEYKPYFSHSNNILTAGSAYNLYASDMQEQIKFSMKELSIKYVKIWNVFSTRFMIRKEEDKKNEDLNFDNIDRIFDFCVENNILLFIDLGSRQETVMTGKKSYLYKNNENIAFGSVREWLEFLSVFIKHLIKRYGASIIAKWVFEFPAYFNSTPFLERKSIDFLDIWKKCHATIKAILPECRVAGPGMITFSDHEMTRNEIIKLINSGCAPDIFTMIIFPYVEYEVESETHLKRLANNEFFKDEASTVADILKSIKFEGELWVTEWNDSISNRNHVQDSCHRATFILKNILETDHFIDSFGYWYTSDLINTYYDSKSILNGSSGLLTKNGICKPAFYALNFMSRLGEYVIHKGSGCIITTNSSNSFRIIFFNNIELGPAYFMKEEANIHPTDVARTFEHSNMMEIELNLQHILNNRTYMIHQEIVSEQNGSIMDKWIELGCEPELTLKDIAYLKRTCIPKVVKSKVKVDNDELLLNITLEPHEIRFIHITLDD